MPKIERKIEIKAPAKRIYDILNDDALETVWNITVNESTEIGTDKYSLKTTVGDMTSTIIERVENKKISYEFEGSPMTKMGYILTPKGDVTEVAGWAEFESEAFGKVLETAADMLLNSLKKFAEYVESGGNPDEYDKKK